MGMLELQDVGAAVGEKGPHTKPDHLGGSCLVGLANSETKRKHTGWSEHRNSRLKVCPGGSHILGLSFLDEGQSLP